MFLGQVAHLFHQVTCDIFGTADGVRWALLAGRQLPRQPKSSNNALCFLFHQPSTCAEGRLLLHNTRPLPLQHPDTSLLLFTNPRPRRGTRVCATAIEARVEGVSWLSFSQFHLLASKE